MGTKMDGQWRKTYTEGIDELLGHMKAERFLEKTQNQLLTTIYHEGPNFTIERKRPNVMFTNQLTIGQSCKMNTFKSGFYPSCYIDFENGVLSLKAEKHDYTHKIQVENGKLKETFSVKGRTAVRWSEKVLD